MLEQEYVLYARLLETIFQDFSTNDASFSTCAPPMKTSESNQNFFFTLFSLLLLFYTVLCILHICCQLSATHKKGYVHSTVGSFSHSRFGKYFCSNLYGRTPRGPRGVKKPDFFLQIKLLSFCARIAPKRHKLRKIIKIEK